MMFPQSRTCFIMIIALIITNTPKVAASGGLSTITVDDCGRTVLHLAAEDGNNERVRQLISDAKYDINALDNDGATPLFLAVYKDRNHVIVNQRGDIRPSPLDAGPHWETTAITLLDNGADPSIRPSIGNTVLHIAADKGMINLIDRVCKKYPKAIKESDTKGDTLDARSQLVRGVNKPAVEHLSKKADSNRGIAAESKSTEMAHMIDAQNSYGQTPMMVAADLKYWSVVKCLLFQGADPTIPTKVSEETLLHIAAKNGLIDVVDYICVNFPVAINAKNAYGETSIFHAVRSRLVEVVKCVLKYAAAVAEDDHNNGDANIQTVAQYKLTSIVHFIDAQNTLGKTPIMVAADLKYWNIVLYLLSLDADLTISDLDGCTLLHIAAKHGQVSVIDKILSDGRVDKQVAINFKDQYGYTPFLLAMKYQHLAAANIFLDYGADILSRSEKYGEIALHFAVERPWIELATTLIVRAVDPSYINTQDHLLRTPLHRTIIKYSVSRHSNIVSMVDILIRNGADQAIRDQNHCTALHYGALSLMVDIVQILAKSAKPGDIDAQNANGQSPLHLAIIASTTSSGEGDRAAIVTILLDSGADPSLHGNHYRTPLHYAAKFHMVDIAQILVNCPKPVDINAKDCDGRTPLHLAILASALSGQSNQIAMVKFLMNNGADPTIPDVFGRIPLHYSAKDHSVELAEILLDGADRKYINAKDVNGRTALHLAKDCYGHDAERAVMVSYLLSKGAKRSLRDHSRMLLGLAKEYGHKKPVGVLRKVNRLLHKVLPFVVRKQQHVWKQVV